MHQLLSGTHVNNDHVIKKLDAFLCSTGAPFPSHPAFPDPVCTVQTGFSLLIDQQKCLLGVLLGQRCKLGNPIW